MEILHSTLISRLENRHTHKSLPQLLTCSMCFLTNIYHEQILKCQTITKYTCHILPCRETLQTFPNFMYAVATIVNTKALSYFQHWSFKYFAFTAPITFEPIQVIYLTIAAQPYNFHVLLICMPTNYYISSSLI